MEREIMNLPVVALRGLVILPEMVKHFDVSRKRSLQAIEHAMVEGQKIFLTAQKDIEVEEPGYEDIYAIGCIAEIKQVLKLPNKLSRVLVVGKKRARLDMLDDQNGYLRADVEVVEDIDTSVEETGADKNPLNLEAMARGLKDIFKEYMSKNPKMMKEMAAQIDQTNDFRRLIDIVAANLPMKLEVNGDE